MACRIRRITVETAEVGCGDEDIRILRGADHQKTGLSIPSGI